MLLVLVRMPFYVGTCIGKCISRHNGNSVVLLRVGIPMVRHYSLGTVWEGREQIGVIFVILVRVYLSLYLFDCVLN